MIPPALFDTHAHLDMPRFQGDHRAVLERARAAGVHDVLVPGVHPHTFEGLHTLASQAWPVRLHQAWGLHPQVIPDVDPAHEHQVLAAVEAMCARVPPLAVGECGLDYRIDLSLAPKDRQRRILRFHLALARRLRLPVLLHCLSAHEDMLAELKACGPFPDGVVMHSFSGSSEQLLPFVKLDAFISFAGPVSWANARKAPRAARDCPAPLLLCETDAPDQSPEPVRGQRNEPAHLIHVVNALAAARGEDALETASTCTRNALRLFRLGPPSEVG